MRRFMNVFFGAIALITTLVKAADADIPERTSDYGTLDAPTYQPFLRDNPLPGGYPWGNCEAHTCDPRHDTPRTGVTRKYEFTVRRGKAAPDGVVKDVILINNQFPGPTIEANWGDWIEVKVHNRIESPAEGTALHWHGLSQKETPWYDGMPSVSQCPIAPGSSFTYRFRADTYGTSWYHGHYSAQYAGGLLGPMIIHGPSHVKYDVDLGPIMIGDWYHREYFDVVKDAASNSSDFNVYVPQSNNILINGMNPFNCTLAKQNNPKAVCRPTNRKAKFQFQAGKTYRLRLINNGAAAMARFSLDNHKLQVIAHDFVQVEPYDVEYLSLHNGQRADVLVKATGQPGDAYWMRATTGMNCTRSQTLESRAVVLYKGAPRDAVPESKSYNIPDNNCGGEDLTKTHPVWKMTPDPIPATTETIEIDLFTNSTGHHVWHLNGKTHRANYNYPMLLLANHKNFSYPNPEWGVHNYGTNKTVRIVLNNKYQASHPMHLHGMDFYVLSEGDGYWDGKTIVNPKNPLRRDTHMLRRYGHLVIQIDRGNPGIWPFHCHIAWHASMGFTLNVMTEPEKISKMEIPMIMDQTCVDWEMWTKHNVVNQIDAGV